MSQSTLSAPVRVAIEIAVYLLLILAIATWCLQIVSPFISFIIWGAVIAVAVYNPFLKLRSVLGGRNKLAVLLFVLIGLGIIIVDQILRTSGSTFRLHIMPIAVGIYLPFQLSVVSL